MNAAKYAHVAVAIVAIALSYLPLAASAAPVDPTSLVDTLVGTSGNGFDGSSDTFPGADAPFGMIQWSPDTPSMPGGGGYNYNDSAITGLSLTHLSGPGCNALGDVGILPTTGPVTDPANSSEAFSHASEVTAPGYYEIMLGMPSVRTQLTATTRSGLGSFTFPPTTQANVLVNASSSQAGVASANIRIVGDRDVVGSVTSGWFCGMPGTYTVYFAIQFDRPFTAHGTWLAKHVMPQTDEANGVGAGGWVTFDATSSSVVRAKTAVSWVSIAGAQANLRAEATTWDIDRVRRATAAQWSSELIRVRVSGGTDVQQRIFYTALYHAMLHPNVYSDADGNYRGFDGQVHRVDPGHVEYATFSGWDIYRTQIPLMALLEPKRTSDMMRSLVHAARQSGWLPKWSLANVETAVMGGDPSDPILAAGYAFGARDFDARAALAAMVKGASTTSGAPGQGWYYQRPGLDEYLSRGYVVNTHTTNVAPVANGASLTLEYAFDDFSIAQLAQELGDQRTYRSMLSRAQNWSNLFDQSTGQIAPRDPEGAFVHAPITDAGQIGFQEGTAAQYTWMVPQNLSGLIAGMGGRASAIGQLDAFFSQIDAGGDKPFSWMGNEPSIGSPWTYLSAGAPWKGQRVIRDVMTQLWGDTPDGIPGNDDLGTMSAWFVWCALGLYPQNPAAPVLDLGTPLFPHASIRVPGGPSIDIDAPQASADNAFIESARLNGKAWPRSWVGFSPGRQMRLDFTVGARPNTRWATAPSNAPPSYASGPVHFPPSTAAWFSTPTPMQLTLAPGGAAALRLGITNAVGVPVSVGWHFDPPDGFDLTPTSGRLDAPSGAGHEIVAQIAVEPHVLSGVYDISIEGESDAGALLPRTTAIVRVARPGEMLALAYAANYFDDSVTPIDLRTRAVGAPITVDGRPRDLALSPDGKRLYVTDDDANDISVIDTASQSVVATVKTGKTPWGIRVTPNGSNVWFANYDDGTVQSIDAATLVAGKPISVGRNPGAAAISPDGATLYVADEGSNDMTRIDIGRGVVLDAIPVGARPRGVAVAPNGKTVYVSNYAGNSVTPIDVASGKADPNIAVGVGPKGLAVTRDGRWLYVANFGSGTVTPVDLSSDTPEPPISVGLSPVAITFDAAGATAFVVNAGDNDCVSIDLKTAVVGARIRLGDRPLAIAP